MLRRASFGYQASAMRSSSPSALSMTRRIGAVSSTLSNFNGSSNSSFIRSVATAGNAANKNDGEKKKTYTTNMYSQPHLPSLPVPELDATLHKYLENVRLFLTPEELARTQSLVEQFRTNEGPILQQKLQQHARKVKETTGRSWLIDWWNSWAYMDYKDSVVINVSYTFNTVEPRVRVPQTRRAATLTHAATLFKLSLHGGTLTPDMGKDGPICMAMYRYLFNTARIPHKATDVWQEYHDDPQAQRQVVVMHKNRYFIVDIFDKQGNLLSIPDIESLFDKVIAMSPESEEWSVGPLTSENRVVWAEARDQLLKSPKNTASLKAIEGTLFGVCLEDTAKTGLDMERELWHGTGRNRFFDKSFQFIIMNDGHAGYNGEHSAVDGSPAWRLMGDVLMWEDAYLKDQKYEQEKPKKAPLSALTSPVELKFDLSPEIIKYIKNAEERLAKNASEVGLQVLYFNHFGKNAMKQWGLSPDAFCQMAMQLAVYRLTSQLYPTYESGATRAFAYGRTETVRSVSPESVEWLKAMTSSDVSDEERFKLLIKACNRHQKTNTDACAGQGIDRHLLGLKLIAAQEGQPTPALFTDPAYSKTCTWKLSTSQLSSPHFQVVFGPVAEDGIGCCYGINEDKLHFKASTAFKSSVDATQFCNAVETALLDMAKLSRACATTKAKAKF